MPGVVQDYVDRQAYEALYDHFYEKAVEHGMEYPGYRADRDALDLHGEATREAAARLHALEIGYPRQSWSEIAERIFEPQVEQEQEQAQRAAQERITIPVTPEMRVLAEKIDTRIAQLNAAYQEISDDAYTTRGENRNERFMLGNIQEHLRNGWREIDLTTDINYEQDTTGIALDKDVYERVTASVSDVLQEARQLGFAYTVTQFHDQEYRWDFAEPQEDFEEQFEEERNISFEYPERETSTFAPVAVNAQIEYEAPEREQDVGVSF